MGRMHIRWALCAAGLGVAGGDAFAQDTSGYYAKVFGGVSGLQDGTVGLGASRGEATFETGSLLGAAVGYDYAGRPLRAEIEFAYRTGDAEGLPAGIGTGGDFASTSFMLNGYYMFGGASGFVPYVGLGVGYVSEIDFDVEGGAGAGEYSDRGLLGWQAMVGVEYAVSSRVMLFGEARYFTAGSADLEGAGGAVLTADYDALELNVGLGLRF